MRDELDRFVVLALSGSRWRLVSLVAVALTVECGLLYGVVSLALRNAR